ncbi:MAG: PorT family protein [Chlorobi bacterium]|nr:PorT family protein [Chlorobiota bacterium]
MTHLKNLKAVLITLFLTGITIVSFAQITAGGRIGANFANLSGKSIQNSSMIVGYNIGGFANYSLEDLITSDFGKIISVQVEFALEQKGATTDYLFYSDSIGSPIYTDTGAKQVSTYMTIPVLAKFTFGDPKALQYFGEAGFYAAALSGLTINGEKWRDDDHNTATDKRKYRDEYSGFDYGFIIGGGASMPFGGRRSPWRAYANLRYAMGFSNIGELKEKTIDIPEGQLEDIKTNTISLLLGVSYSF